ncbi:hypothetical protein ANN_18270 [Periplaneta americana]|uniref:Uncharacterized protein n=1 Tax=Periplaneta americana TaxID=6978 RepID=A0ABQ8SNA4_PERAM|nr:hypothetical protein ANN_18270 [Periplaneta americana]
MWKGRRFERVKWTDRIRNEAVLERVTEERMMLKLIRKRKTLYEAETWTLQRSEEKRLEAFEMWIWRRMEHVKWTCRIRNLAVLERVDEERIMLKLIRKRERNWLGVISVKHMDSRNIQKITGMMDINRQAVTQLKSDGQTEGRKVYSYVTYSGRSEA